MQQKRLSIVVVAVLLATLAVPTTSFGAPPSHAYSSSDSFDPALYGRILAEDELDAVDGEFWNVAISVGIGVAGYIYGNGVDMSSAEWWGGLAVTTVVSAVLPSSGASVAANSLSGAASLAMNAYGHLVSAVVTFGPYLSE